MKLHKFFIAFLFTFITAAHAPWSTAQDATPPVPQNTTVAANPDETARGQKVPPQYESPRKTMQTFIASANQAIKAANDGDKLLESKAKATALSCLDLSMVNKERGWTLSTQLLGILNRLGEFHEWELSDADDVKRNNMTRETYFPHEKYNELLQKNNISTKGEITLTKQPNGYWLFSAETISKLDELYLNLEPLPIMIGADERVINKALWLRQYMPKSMKGEAHQVLSMEYWQWLLLLIFIFLGLLADQLVRLLLRFIIKRFFIKQGKEVNKETMTKAVKPAGLLVMALFWLSVVWMLALPDLAYTIIYTAARIFAVLAGVLFAWRGTDLATDAAMIKAANSNTKIDDVIVPMIRTTLKIFIVIFGLIYGGQSLNIDITPMIASLTIAGAGFAFAAKDTLENFFGSATVLIDQPFGVGDWVVIGNTEGTVETIGFRSSRIRTFYNSLVTVPNANLIRTVVDNYGKRKYRRWKTTIGVQYDTTPEQLVAFTEGIREIVRTHPYTRKDYFQIWTNGFGASSIDILLYVFHETPDWTTELRERERLILDIIRLANHLDVHFAYPTQTLHVYQEDKNQITEPAPSPTSMTERRSMVQGIRKAQELMKDQPWQKDIPGPVTFENGPTRLNDDDENQIENRTSGS